MQTTSKTYVYTCARVINPSVRLEYSFGGERLEYSFWAPDQPQNQKKTAQMLVKTDGCCKRDRFSLPGHMSVEATGCRKKQYKMCSRAPF